MSVRRWRFDDSLGEVWTVPINPNEMTDPETRIRTFQFAQYDWSKRFRSFEAPSQINEWSFGGVIQDKVHYDKLLHWSMKPTNVRITDHLGRTYSVIMKAFEPVERRPTRLRPWRFTYNMRALVMRRIS